GAGGRHIGPQFTAAGFAPEGTGRRGGETPVACTARPWPPVFNASPHSFMSPEFFYFDLGRVLLDFDHTRMLRQMAELVGVSVETMAAAVMPSGDPSEGDPQWRLEAGELDEDVYFAGLCHRLGVRPDRAELDRAVSDIFTPIDASMRLAERLHGGGHRLGLLSNTNPIHWRWCLGSGRYPTLDRVFEVGVSSFEAKSMKPDAAIYRHAIARAGVPAERIFFTDDRPENVAGAIACGIDAVLFTGAEALVGDLDARGVAC
ncbi:MAG: HAD family phosphatase, partial [Planctomycetota bacterium]